MTITQSVRKIVRRKNGGVEIEGCGIWGLRASEWLTTLLQEAGPYRLPEMGLNTRNGIRILATKLQHIIHPDSHSRYG